MNKISRAHFSAGTYTPYGLPIGEKNLYMTSYKTGQLGEQIASKYLRKHNWHILDTNWKKQIGEIDIIAKKNGKIHFIEVKMRKSTNYNPAIENLTATKKKRFLKIGLLWATLEHLDEDEYQFDCIAIEKKMTSWRISHFMNIELKN